MQLREDIQVLSTNKDECPINDWMCRFFENGGCKLNNAKDNCSHMRNSYDKKIKKTLE